MSLRDTQRRRVYSWEDEYVSPKDKGNVPYAQLQMVVDHIWNSEGLQFPPKIVPMPLQNTKAWSMANRMEIFARENGMPTWVLIHEMAHSLTINFDQSSPVAAHGKTFVGIYIKLLEKYLNIPLVFLMYTANQSGVEFDINARPIFLD